MFNRVMSLFEKRPLQSEIMPNVQIRVEAFGCQVEGCKHSATSRLLVSHFLGKGHKMKLLLDLCSIHACEALLSEKSFSQLQEVQYTRYNAGEIKRETVVI